MHALSDRQFVVYAAVRGKASNERVLAVAENAAQAILNGQPTAVPKNADGTAEDDPPDQSGPGCRREDWHRGHDQFEGGAVNAPRKTGSQQLRVFIALLRTHRVCAFHRNLATQLIEWVGRTDEDDVQ